MSFEAIEKNECLNDIPNSSMNEIFGESEERDNLYDQFKTDYSQCCDVNGKHRNNCKRAVKQSYYRRLPGISTLVYPWRNYDFNYSNVLDKKINMKAIGASSSGSMGSMMDNTKAAIKIYSAAMIDPIPDKNDKANVTDRINCVNHKIEVTNDIYNDSINDSCDGRLSTYFGAMVIAMPMIWFGDFFFKIAGGIMAAGAQVAWAEPNFKKCMDSFNRGDGTAGDMGEIFSLGLATMSKTKCRPGNLRKSNGTDVKDTQVGDAPYYKCDTRHMTCEEAQKYVRKRVPVPLQKFTKSYQWTNRKWDEPLTPSDKDFGGKDIAMNHGDTSGVYSKEHDGPYTVSQATSILGSLGNTNQVYVCTACNNKKESFDKMMSEYTKKCLDWENCNVGNEIKTDMYKDLDKEPPYNNSFFKRPLDGVNSSSYFIKSGLCYQPTIYTEKQCLSNNPKKNDKKSGNIRGGSTKELYYWTPNNLKKHDFASKFPTSKANMFTKEGNCYRAKYSFIDNSPGIKTRNPLTNQKFTLPMIQGLYPSMAQDMFAMSPMSAMSVYLGISTGDFEDMKCLEFFTNINQKSKSTSIRLFNVLVVFLLLIFIYALYRK